MNNEKFEEDLDKIEEYIRKENYKNLQSCNLFKILKIEDLEIRHSNFLQWLFDLNNNFEVASIFINKFLKTLGIDCGSLTNIMDCDEDFVRAIREEDNIDILVKFKDLKQLIVIENKIYSTENNNQLTRYYNCIENKKDELKDYTKHYLYLTLTGEEPLQEEDKKHWKPFSYNEIKNIIGDILKNCSKSLSVKTKIILKDYYEILKEKTEDKMDRVEYYHKLYKEHKNILLDMINYIPQIQERAKIEKDYILKKSEFMLNTPNANSYIYFSNKEVDEALKKYNVPKRFIEFCFSNEPCEKLLFTITISKYNNLYKNFVKDFKQCFGLKESVERNGDYVILYTKTLHSLKNKIGGYITEREFQEDINVLISDYFESQDSEYFKIVNFIKNYNFGN